MNKNLPLATVRATTDWRYKTLANVFFISLVLFIISLFKKTWTQVRLPLLSVFVLSGLGIYFLIKHLGRVEDVPEDKLPEGGYSKKEDKEINKK